MFEFIKAFFQSLFPDYGQLLKRGFQTRIFNGDLILSKSYGKFSFHLHQALEPFNSKFGHLVDFEIKDVCFIFHWPGESLDRAKAIDFYQKIFDNTYVREDYCFCELKKVKWEDPRILEAAVKCDEFFQLNF
jgi:hypothetical protein